MKVEERPDGSLVFTREPGEHHPTFIEKGKQVDVVVIPAAYIEMVKKIYGKQ